METLPTPRFCPQPAHLYSAKPALKQFLAEYNHGKWKRARIGIGNGSLWHLFVFPGCQGADSVMCWSGNRGVAVVLLQMNRTHPQRFLGSRTRVAFCFEGGGHHAPSCAACSLNESYRVKFRGQMPNAVDVLGQRLLVYEIIRFGYLFQKLKVHAKCIGFAEA